MKLKNPFKRTRQCELLYRTKKELFLTVEGSFVRYSLDGELMTVVFTNVSHTFPAAKLISMRVNR
jgi:hypothetical protein